MIAKKEIVNEIVPLIIQLWPDNSEVEARKIIEEYICGKDTGAFVQLMDNQYAGLALCSLRHDYVEGCDSSPVGYLEGIVVGEKFQRQGIAKILCHECEQWAKEKGCKEFASDCEITNENSRNFHISIGFAEENRIICFKKEI